MLWVGKGLWEDSNSPRRKVWRAATRFVDVSPTLINAVGSKQGTRFFPTATTFTTTTLSTLSNWKRTETLWFVKHWISLEKLIDFILSINFSLIFELRHYNINQQQAKPPAADELINVFATISAPVLQTLAYENTQTQRHCENCRHS